MRDKKDILDMFFPTLPSWKGIGFTCGHSYQNDEEDTNASWEAPRLNDWTFSEYSSPFEDIF